MKLIDADKLSADMYHEAFVKDSDMQKWDSGCWIRYKMFENALKAQPAVEPEVISKWKKEFREYVDSLDIARDDWKGIVEYIDELPSAEPDTTTHDSIPAKTGKNNCDRTSGDCISRRQAIEVLRNRWLKTRNYEGIGEDIAEECEIYLKMLPPIQPERKTGRWIPDDSELGIKCNKCGKSFSDYVNAGTGYMFLEETPNFCPNCGADMRGEQNDN